MFLINPPEFARYGQKRIWRVAFRRPIWQSAVLSGRETQWTELCETFARCLLRIRGPEDLFWMFGLFNARLRAKAYFVRTASRRGARPIEYFAGALLLSSSTELLDVWRSSPPLWDYGYVIATRELDNEELGYELNTLDSGPGMLLPVSTRTDRVRMLDGHDLEYFLINDLTADGLDIPNIFKPLVA